MELYSESNNYKLYHGNMLDMLDVIEPNSIDSIVTDPPYELNFMNKGWDNAGISFQKETWEKCLTVLKPGGYLLVFGGSRTFHRIACAIEDAGFEIRDTIMWLYGSGFPKSMNVGLAIDKKKGIDNRTGNRKKDGVGSDSDSKIYNVNNGKSNMTKEYEERVARNKWKGWGTCLKPSFEPIIVARKPFKGSLIDNIIKNGVGGINIDECRVGKEIINIHNAPKGTFAGGEYGRGSDTSSYRDSEGRFPANTILTYDEVDFDEVCGGFPYSKSSKTSSRLLDIRCNNYNNSNKHLDIIYERGFNDSGSASRYFYCAKASKRDRDEGLEHFEKRQGHTKGNGLDRICEFCGVSQLTPELCKCEIKSWVAKPKKNIHPTVKPTSLMQYLVKLATPNNGIILDPFNGSGSTGKAVMYENYDHNKNYKYIGIEIADEYLKISKARIEYVCNLKGEKQTDISDFI